MPQQFGSSSDLRSNAIAQWLSGTFTFTHFLTLATNTPGVSLRVMRDRIKHWDARVNRELLGPKWHQHWDEATWWFAFLEKPETNAHWHVLCLFEDADRLPRLALAAARAWCKILPAGTVDVQRITEKSESVIDYVVKRAGGEIEYANCIAPDEFRRS